jgi:hypothetical protein
MRFPLAALFVCLAAVAQAQSPEFGVTFHQLDADATRAITWHADAYVITERGSDQHLRTRLFDRRSATVLASAEYDAGDAGLTARMRADLGSETVTLEQAAAPRRHIAWANTQLRQLWLDHRARRAGGLVGPPAFVTEGGLWRMRDVGDARASEAGTSRTEDDVDAIATEFGGPMAVTQRDHHAAPPKGDRVALSTFTTRMYDTGGRQVGFLRWFDKERVLTWSFPNGRRGTAIEATVPGGFKFTPTLAWANVQALAFLKQSDRPAPPAVPVPALPGGAAQPVAVSAIDEPARGPCASEAAGQDAGCDGVPDGCTGLHWLDDTIFRECCDRHDRCFEREYALGNCCDAWSWLFPNPFWHCARCNFAVAWCFATGGRDPWDSYRWNDGGCGGDLCTRCSAADWCDVECASCRTREDRSGGDE